MGSDIWERWEMEMRTQKYSGSHPAIYKYCTAVIAMSSLDLSRNTQGVGVVVSHFQMKILNHQERMTSWD